MNEIEKAVRALVEQSAKAAQDHADGIKRRDLMTNQIFNMCASMVAEANLLDHFGIAKSVGHVSVWRREKKGSKHCRRKYHTPQSNSYCDEVNVFVYLDTCGELCHSDRAYSYDWNGVSNKVVHNSLDHIKYEVAKHVAASLHDAPVAIT